MSDGRPNALPGSGPEQNNDSGNSNFESSARDAASGVDHYQSDVRSEAGRLSALEADAATTISSLASSNSNYPASNRFSPVLPLSSMREDTNSLLAASQLLSGPPNSSREAANRYHAPAGYAFHPSPPALAAPLPYAYDSAPGQLNARRTSYESQMSIDERGNSSSGSQETALGLMQLHQLPQLPSGPAKQIKRPNKLTPSAKAKGKGKARKSLDDDPDELESDFEGKKLAKGKARKPAGEKKKTSRACGACQKAHLTCDDARPCARCVKKGCPDQCQDGARKKAKYLQEIPDELLERRPSIPTPLPIPILPAIQPADSALPPPSMLPPPVDNPAPSFSFDTMPFYDSNAFANEFGSEAANLEYAILSSMLNGNGFAVNGNDQYGVGGPTEFNAAENDGSMLMHSPGGRNLIDSNGRSEGSATADTNNHAAGSVASTSRGGYTNSIFDRATLRSPPPASYGQVVSPPRLQDAASADLFQAVSAGLKSSSTPFAPQNGQTIDPTTSTPLEAPSAYPGRTAQSVQPLTSEEAYRTVTKPYPYAQSYHYLVQHLKERFEKNDILRIIRALATFRPSLIALQMPLSEEDETFVERTFQRTLVELNKLISFSGTPTVVWRRTGEICLVGTEFCLLTGWSREELLGKKYIFELFDTGSVVEYYESFAKHAFESTSSSVMTQCVVLGPSGRPVPCAFCFSVRRDLFSCPFLVIGSFLPVLV